jgi:hypothetical protein
MMDVNVEKIKFLGLGRFKSFKMNYHENIAATFVCVVLITVRTITKIRSLAC